MTGILDFLHTISSAVTSWAHSMGEMVKTVALVSRALPTYTGVLGGVFAFWIVAGISCAVIFRVVGRE